MQAPRGVEPALEVAQAALARKLDLDHRHELVQASKRVDPIISSPALNLCEKSTTRILLQYPLRQELGHVRALPLIGCRQRKVSPPSIPRQPHDSACVF